MKFANMIEHGQTHPVRSQGVTKHRTGPKYSDILHRISSKSNKIEVRSAWKP